MRIPLLLPSFLILSTAHPAYAREHFDLALVDAITERKAPAKKPLDAIQLPTPPATSAAKPSVLDQARKLNAMPLPLIPTASEQQATDAAALDAEQQQISALWASTLDRSPDIQFVINAMQPASDPNHSRSQAMKLIGGLMFNAGVQATSVFGSAPARIGGGAAASLLDSLLHKGGKPADLSPASVASLYSMIRRSADRLVDAYRAYKNSLDEAVLADEALDDVRKLYTSRDSSLSSDASMFLDIELKHAVKDMRLARQKITTYRKLLFDMAGDAAVAQLDKQIDEEHNALARLTGEGSWRHPLQYTPPSTASQTNAPISP